MHITHKTRVLGKIACRLAGKRLLNKALQVRKEHAGCLLKMARSIQSLQIKGKNDFGESGHTASTELYFYNSAYQLVKRPHAIPIDENGKCIIAEQVKKESAWKQRADSRGCSVTEKPPLTSNLDSIHITLKPQGVLL